MQVDPVKTAALHLFILTVSGAGLSTACGEGSLRSGDARAPGVDLRGGPGAGPAVDGLPGPARPELDLAGTPSGTTTNVPTGPSPLAPAAGTPAPTLAAGTPLGATSPTADDTAGSTEPGTEPAPEPAPESESDETPAAPAGAPSDDESPPAAEAPPAGAPSDAPPPAAEAPPAGAPSDEPADAPPADAPPPAARPGADARFTRRLPDTSDRIHVFYDQLSNRLSDAQYAFAATRAAGTQKVTRNVSARIRATNPDFVVLQYRLAFGLSAEHNIIGENLWDRDTIEPTDAANAGDPRQTREAFYLHVPAGSSDPAHRVRHDDNYWLADVRNRDWQRAHIDELMRRMPTNDFDGVFLDTAHVRWDGLTPSTWWQSFCGPEYHALPGCWHEPALTYYTALTAALHGGDRWFYAIGNFGPLVTEADENAYLAPLDGGMIEHFMYLFDFPNERDWHIVAERITRLIGNDRVLIAEPVGYDSGNARLRRWLIGNFLMFKGRQSFAAFYPRGTDHVDAPVWLPEYDVDLGAPVDPVPADIGAQCTGDAARFACSGLYVRDFARGFVVVNPSGEARSVDLPAPPPGERWAEVDFEGGGYVDADGRPAAQRLIYTALDGVRVTPAPRDARIIVRVDDAGLPVR